MNLNDKYLEVNSRFNKDKKYIIQAFINYYGEQYTGYIYDVFNNLRIVWFDEREYVEGSDVRDYIVSSLSDKEIEEALNKRKSNIFAQSGYIDELDLLVLPLSYDLTHIIHEINHKVSSHLISIEPYLQISGLEYDEGTNINVKVHDEFFNELINQKITLDILEELNNLGYKIHYSSSWQERLFPLINGFYDIFKDLIKEVYITGNLNEFIKKLGEENYVRFTQIIFLKVFRLRNRIRKGEEVKISNEDILLLEECVMKMKNHFEKMNNSYANFNK